MIVAIANQKGGVGKTTTAVTLAHGAALRGLQVYQQDLDSQGNVADSLGLDAGGELYQWLIAQAPLKRIVIAGRDNLDVIRSDKTTALLKVALSGMDFREMVLADKLEEAERYDLVIMDCAPSVDVLHTAALVAADILLTPTKLDQLAIKGVADILQSLATVRRASRSACQLGGVLPTFYDRVTTESHAQLENLAAAFNDLVWPPVPVDTRCRTAHREGRTLWEMEEGTRAIAGLVGGDGHRVGGYGQALDRLLSIGGQR